LRRRRRWISPRDDDGRIARTATLSGAARHRSRDRHPPRPTQRGGARPAFREGVPSRRRSRSDDELRARRARAPTERHHRVTC
jgi:hypothetical protein